MKLDPGVHQRWTCPTNWPAVSVCWYLVTIIWFVLAIIFVLDQYLGQYSNQYSIILLPRTRFRAKSRTLKPKARPLRYGDASLWSIMHLHTTHWMQIVFTGLLPSKTEIAGIKVMGGTCVEHPVQSTHVICEKVNLNWLLWCFQNLDTWPKIIIQTQRLLFGELCATCDMHLKRTIKLLGVIHWLCCAQTTAYFVVRNKLGVVKNDTRGEWRFQFYDFWLVI